MLPAGWMPMGTKPGPKSPGPKSPRPKVLSANAPEYNPPPKGQLGLGPGKVSKKFGELAIAEKPPSWMPGVVLNSGILGKGKKKRGGISPENFNQLLNMLKTSGFKLQLNTSKINPLFFESTGKPSTDFIKFRKILNSISEMDKKRLDKLRLLDLLDFFMYEVYTAKELYEKVREYFPKLESKLESQELVIFLGVFIIETIIDVLKPAELPKEPLGKPTRNPPKEFKGKGLCGGISPENYNRLKELVARKDLAVRVKRPSPENKLFLQTIGEPSEDLIKFVKIVANSTTRMDKVRLQYFEMFDLLNFLIYRTYTPRELYEKIQRIVPEEQSKLEGGPLLSYSITFIIKTIMAILEPQELLKEPLGKPTLKFPPKEFKGKAMPIPTVKNPLLECKARMKGGVKKTRKSRIYLK
jgi:hypothetical protein